MKSLYEINAELREALDAAHAEAEENEGVVSDLLGEKLDNLQQEKTVKIGNICRFIKSLNAEADMVKTEAKNLTDRARVTNNKADYLKKYLAGFMVEGEKFADENSKVSWRKSEAVVIEDNDIEFVPPDFQRIKVEADKTALKKALKEGAEFDGITLVTKQNIQVK